MLGMAGSLRPNRPVPRGTGEVRAFLRLRNEMLRLPWLLDWHRSLGVDRFIAIDNGSEDGTTEFLDAQPDVHVFCTTKSFRLAAAGADWLHALLADHGDGRWCLLLDGDEQLVYPDCETLDLHGLCRFLDSSGAQALFAMLVDMYSDRAIRDTEYRPGRPLVDACPFFDPEPYRRVPIDSCPYVGVLGGARERVFWAGQDRGFASPMLTKVPLIRWRKGRRLLALAHSISPVQLAELSGALLHFKFLADFPERVAEACVRKQHFAEAREYQVYADSLARDPSLSMYHAGAARYRRSEDLVAAGLMHCPTAFRRYVDDAARSAQATLRSAGDPGRQ